MIRPVSGLEVVFLFKKAGLELVRSLSTCDQNENVCIAIDHTINMTWHSDQETTFIKASSTACQPMKSLGGINERKLCTHVKMKTLFISRFPQSTFRLSFLEYLRFEFYFVIHIFKVLPYAFLCCTTT